MVNVYQALPGNLTRSILFQDDLSKAEILRMHRERIDDGKNSAIFGLNSFSEGIDLPSRYCRHVIIAKLPFSAPDDPLSAALSEWIQAKGGNSFMEVNVPAASARLIQACGRLLRTEQDSGRITLLDTRLVTRRYGRAILEALPPFKLEVISLPSS